MTRREIDLRDREIATLRASIAKVNALRDKWEDHLSREQCPGCLASWTVKSTCDHEEGYHLALSDIRAVLS